VTVIESETKVVDGERCRSSLHLHSRVTPEGRETLLDWEAERFHRATTRLGLDSAVTCALHCVARSIQVEIPLERDDGSLGFTRGTEFSTRTLLDPLREGYGFIRR
jgi:hypothetical protein